LDKKAWSPNFLHEVLRSKLPLARKFPGKRKFWALAGKMPGNPFWKEIDRKYNELPG
jgi:hypothetical protein